MDACELSQLHRERDDLRAEVLRLKQEWDENLQLAAHHLNNTTDAKAEVERLRAAIEKLAAIRLTEAGKNFESLDRQPTPGAGGGLCVLRGDARLTNEVRVVVAPGHTRAHQCVVVESGGQTAIFLGDVAFWPIHMERLAWVPAYDVEPMVSIETKRRLAQWAVENHVLLIFEHHPEIVAGYLHPTERQDRFRLEPVDI